MAKKKKKNKKSKVNTSKPISELEQDGRNYLKSEKYRSAIDIFKQILKEKETENILDLLHTAYKGRANELSKAGMFKEAEAIYEVIESKCKTDDKSYDYISILLGSGKYTKVLGLLLTDNDNDKEKEYQILSLIGLLILGNRENDKIDFPEGHILIKDKIILFNVLTEFVAGRERESKELLKKISFKSPFRDFKRLLSGLMKYYNDENDKALEILETIPENSPLKGFSERLKSVISYPYNDSLIKGVSITDKTEQKLFFLLRGYNIHSIVSVNNILKALKQNRFNDIEYIIKSIRNLVSARSLKMFFYGLLFENDDIDKIFSTIFQKEPKLNAIRLFALYSEKISSGNEANEFWYEYLEYIDDIDDKTDINLKKALILRRIAKNKQELFPLDFFDSFDYEEDDWAQDIERSLRYDPYDIDSYKKLLECYTNNKQASKKWSDKFLKYYPDNLDALLLASDNALKRHAYKNALKFLETALEYDPINIEVVHKKIFIHVTKAQKHIIEKKYHLARNEFKNAAETEYNIEKDGTLRIKWGLLEILDNNIEEGNKLLDEGSGYISNFLKYSFIRHIEAKKMNLPAKALKEYEKKFIVALREKHSIENVSSLIQVISDYFLSTTSYPQIEQDIKIIVKYIKVFSKSRLIEIELLTICEFLYIISENGILEKYAETGRKKYPKSVMFIYYLIRIKLRNDSYIPRKKDINEIEKGIMLAEKNRDNKNLKIFENMLSEMKNRQEEWLYEHSPEDKEFEEKAARIPYPRHRSRSGNNPNQMNLFDEE